MKTKSRTSFLCVFALVTLFAIPVQAATVVWWRFEDTAGSTISNSGTGGAVYNAELGNGALFTPTVPQLTIQDQAGQVYSNAQSYQSTLNPGSVLTDPDAAGALSDVFKGNFTIEAFVFTTGDPVWKAVLQQDTSPNIGVLIFGLNGTGALRFYATNGSNYNQVATAPSVFPADQWVHIAAVGTRVGSNTSVQLFINGEEVGNAVSFVNGVALGNDKTLVLGGHNPWKNGYIDEVRISDEALSSDQFLKAIPEGTTYGYIAIGVGLSTLMGFQKRLRTHSVR